MPVSAFGTQFTYPGQFSPWGGAQQGIQGLGINPYAFQQYTQNPPLMSAPLTSTIAGPSVGVQQVLPLLKEYKSCRSSCSTYSNWCRCSCRNCNNCSRSSSSCPGSCSRFSS